MESRSDLCRTDFCKEPSQRKGLCGDYVNKMKHSKEFLKVKLEMHKLYRGFVSFSFLRIAAGIVQ